MTTEPLTDEGHDERSVDAADGSNGAIPPGPDGYPVVGNVHQIMRDPFGFLEELRTYGDVVRYRIVGNDVTALLHPADVQRVLVEEPDRFERYLFADRGFDFAPEGVLFTHGDQWRSQRKVVEPAFTMERIRSYAEPMSAYAEELAATWDDGEEVALNRTFSRLTLRILTKALFDVEVDPGSDDEAITRAARLINEQSSSRSFAAFLPRWLPTPGNRRYRRAMAAYRERVDDLIDRRRGDGGDDLLSNLLHAETPDGETLTDEEVRDNLITFTFAGHETTSLALTYTFVLLATHDDVRARLEAELEDVLDGSTPGFEDVPALEYTDRVVTEAMRLYPPAYMLFRKATEDAVVGGYELPEGSIVALPTYAIHHDGRFYDEPDAFRPERWADGYEAELPEYAYFPFGGGPRHCIGMRFARLELALVVATLVQRLEFDLLSDPEPALSPGATLQPASDVRVRVRKDG
ncbi:cytochrome P450 [Natronobeatus ordinarius]|uniref:cytochrome P450 n=1 Tax=Natronobeatus ordinarius TaxID=2963433 RepID=UPI0020CF41AF|nr:cytochrome P450 [Natronobeatus ordinarius]